jgi:hypothetical protein
MKNFSDERVGQAKDKKEGISVVRAVDKRSELSDDQWVGETVIPETQAKPKIGMQPDAAQETQTQMTFMI